jgi:signal transduction histidine kinase
MNWLLHPIRDYVDQVNRADLRDMGAPLPLVATVCSGVGLILICRYVPSIHSVMGLHGILWPCVMIACAGVCSFLMGRYHGRRPGLSALFSFLDTALYGGTLVLLALSARPPARYAIEGIFVLAVVYWSLKVPISLIFAVDVFLVPCAMALGKDADAGSWVLLAGSFGYFVFASTVTRRLDARRRRSGRSEELFRRVDAVMKAQTDQAFKARRVRVASALHEIRRGLVPAAWNLDHVAARGTLSEEHRRVIAEAKAGIEGTAATIQDILTNMETDRAETGSFLVQELLEGLRGDEGMRSMGGLEIRESLPNMRVHGVVEAIRLVVGNLVENAFEAGARHVVVSTSPPEDRDGCVIAVEDDGPGLPRPVQDKLFEPFNTLGKHGGIGLGLYLSKQLAGLSGGDLALVKTDDSGTVFEIFLASQELAEEHGPRQGRDT